MGYITGHFLRKHCKFHHFLSFVSHLFPYDRIRQEVSLIFKPSCVFCVLPFLFNDFGISVVRNDIKLIQCFSFIFFDIAFTRCKE